MTSSTSARHPAPHPAPHLPGNDGQPLWLFVQAEPDPGLLPRILGQLARRSLLPDHFHCSRGPDGLDLDLRLDAIDGAAAEVLAASLRQMIGVRAVLTTTA